jgi:transposase-like protein
MKTIDKADEKEELTLISLAQEYADEDKARGLLERMRWPDGPVCPHCQNAGVHAKGVVPLTPKATSKRPARKGLYFCGACRKQFSVTVGSVFEGSHIPISKWVIAMFLICSSKKGMSAHQLHRMLKVTYKTAWFMAHRIRYAMGEDSNAGNMLKGVVEIDETFVGGKGDRTTKHSRKTPVMALIEQGGSMKARVVAGVSYKNLGKVLFESVSKDAVICSDENTAYKSLHKNFKAHHSVVHSKSEYILKTPDGISAGTNRCESFFSLLKRGVHGAWHNVSREHLQKYVNEFAFRWNTRKDTDGDRMEKFAGMIGGKRLTYRQAV